MQRHITVKGAGRVTVRPDWVVVSLTLETVERDYAAAMAQAAEKITALEQRLGTEGFSKEAVKTTEFSVSARHESRRRSDGSYGQRFVGYAVRQEVKVAFDWDTARLGLVLGAVSDCLAHPALSVSFTVKDPTAVSEALLAAAAENARRKATVLCAASGVALGSLVSIDYSWKEVNVFSPTDYCLPEDCAVECKAAAPELEPEDITVSDTVTFVWELA